MSNQNADAAKQVQRRKRRSYALLVLAAGIFAFGAASGFLYYVLRPTVLRIAVGPAGSEDQKLIQLMAQTFKNDGSGIRLSLVITPGANDSATQFTQGKVDLAVVRALELWQ